MMTSYKARRENVFKRMPDNSVAVLNAAPLLHRNSDTEFPFRQDSYFYYLSGFNETNALIVLSKKDGKETFTLFCQDKDPIAEQWTGKRAGQIGACEIYGADVAYAIDEANFKMPNLLANASCVYFLTGLDKNFDKSLFSWVDKLRKKVRQGLNAPHQYFDFRQLLDEERLIKSSAEIELMRKAATISSKAHQLAIEHCQVGMHEYVLEGILLNEFCRQGARFPAYPCIVATGNNACTLHYTQNNTQIKDGDLVLIDAGAEYDSYAADITRTFPANGKFSGPQCAIYELVLASQIAALNELKPGVTWDVMQNKILQVIVQGLIDLKILKGELKTLIEEKAYLPFYMHNSGHWLGMDVHDVGEYKVQNQWRTLAPNMVFTVEPGIYISQNNTQVDEKWRGIGVRIEDDVAITQNGFDVLTKDIVKTVQDIEKLMQ